MSGLPLRVRLVAALLALLCVGLLVIGVASAVALRSYLLTRVDNGLAGTAQTVGRENLPRQATTVVLPSEYVLGLGDRFGNWSPVYDGRVLSAEDLPVLRPAEPGDLYTAKGRNGKLRWRVLVSGRPNGEVLIVAHSLAGVDSAVDRLVTAELVGGAGVLAVLAVLGVAIVRMSLRPLVEIEHTAAAIAGGELGRRVPQPDPRTEVGRLARALNIMLAQIEEAFAARAASEQAARAAEAAARTAEAAARAAEERMRRFVADASHELRTPLTAIRGFAELHRQGAAPDPGPILARIEDEAARMGLLVEDLLLLARLDRERPLAAAPVALRDLATDAVFAARAVDPERPVALELPDDDVVVVGDEARLRQVVGNLLTNALTHTPAGTPVTVRLAVEAADAVLEVRDQGSGIAAEEAERVFERFYRVDKARTRRSGPAGGHSGAGLGLAIVAALVAAHHGRVELETAPGAGAAFRVRLPLSASSQGASSMGGVEPGKLDP
jgi:two-component system OmpR family sensor kinase